jgi:hypothetical protein
MWCPSCRAEVAAEVAADNRRVRCATCGSEIPVPASFAGLGKTREARELLDRWASERQSEAPPTRPSRASSGPNRSFAGSGGGGVSLEADSETVGEESQTTSRRFDLPQTLAGPVAAEPNRGSGRGYATAGSATASQRVVSRAEARPVDSVRSHRIDGPDFAGPNFDIQGSLLETDRRKTNWTYVLGQLLAYAGVALLTVGSTLVLWGYFGGPASYAPTGWLTTMAGQMLLILGVVTLVSGGMEQTNEDVRVRIERIGERIIRIEQIARDHALRGPVHPADFAQGQTVDAGTRQDAELRR